jgi:hypothetical protein
VPNVTANATRDLTQLKRKVAEENQDIRTEKDNITEIKSNIIQVEKEATEQCQAVGDRITCLSESLQQLLKVCQPHLPATAERHNTDYPNYVNPPNTIYTLNVSSSNSSSSSSNNNGVDYVYQRNTATECQNSSTGNEIPCNEVFWSAKLIIQ